MKKISFLIASMLIVLLSQAQYQIPIPTNKPFSSNFINSSGFGDTKDIRKLFDGDVETGFNVDGISSSIAFPYRGFIILDSIYNLTQATWLSTFSNGAGFSIFFYDQNRQQVGDSITGTVTGYYNVVNTSITRNGVRFIEFRSYDQTLQLTGLGELRFTGTATAAATSLLPTPNNTAIADVGVKAIGVNEPGDRINKITQAGDTIMKFATRSFRTYPIRGDWDYSPDIYNGPMLQSPLWLGRYGTDHNKNYYDKVKRWGMDMTFSSGNGTIKGSTAQVPNGVWPGNYTYNWVHYTEPNANLSTFSAWAAFGRLMGNFAALFGPNPNALLTATVLGGTSTKGQNQFSYIETGNEENRWWVESYYLNPRRLYAAHKTAYDSIKVRSANLPVHLAALPGIDYEYWKAIWFEHYWETGSSDFPADGINFNMYLNNGGGQNGNGTVAIRPEQWHPNVPIIDSFFKVYFPARAATWSEFGYATDDGSPFDVDPIGGKSDRQVAADWELRLKAIVQARSRVVNRMQNYAVFEDFTGPFNSMAMIQDVFDGGSVYQYSSVFPKGYAQANEIYCEQNYKWFSTIIQNGDSTGNWVTMKNHNTDSTKKLIKVWRGTRNGSTANQVVAVGGATAAKMYTLRYDRFLPDSTNLSVSNNQFTVPATESMSWVEVTVSGGNFAPTANAGTDKSITLPTSQVTLNGTGTDTDGSIASYAWTKLTGTGGTITSPSSATTSFTGLSAGTYTLRLLVTDNLGATSADTAQVTVSSGSSSSEVVANCTINNSNKNTLPRVYRFSWQAPNRVIYRLTLYACGGWIRERWVNNSWTIIGYQ